MFRVLILLSLFFALPALRAEINFMPTIEKYVSYGAEYSTVSFKDDKRTIAMEVPRKWTCRGDASRLQFFPPDQNLAEGIVQTLPPLRTRVFDEATVKALEAQVINGLPPGSQNATVLTRLENSVLLYENSSFEFTVSFQTLGQTFHRSVIFVNCPSAQIVFRFTAPKAVFVDLNKTFNRSISSWRFTDPPNPADQPIVATAAAQAPTKAN